MDAPLAIQICEQLVMAEHDEEVEAQHEIRQARERIAELEKEIQHNVELIRLRHKRVEALKETTKWSLKLMEETSLI